MSDGTLRTCLGSHAYLVQCVDRSLEGGALHEAEGLAAHRSLLARADEQLEGVGLLVVAGAGAGAAVLPLLPVHQAVVEPAGEPGLLLVLPPGVHAADAAAARRRLHAGGRLRPRLLLHRRGAAAAGSGAATGLASAVGHLPDGLAADAGGGVLLGGRGCACGCSLVGVCAQGEGLAPLGTAGLRLRRDPARSRGGRCTVDADADEDYLERDAARPREAEALAHGACHHGPPVDGEAVVAPGRHADLSLLHGNTRLEGDAVDGEALRGGGRVHESQLPGALVADLDALELDDRRGLKLGDAELGCAARALAGRALAGVVPSPIGGGQHHNVSAVLLSCCAAAGKEGDQNN